MVSVVSQDDLQTFANDVSNRVGQLEQAAEAAVTATTAAATSAPKTHATRRTGVNDLLDSGLRYRR